MNYLRVGRATDLDDAKERKIFRVLEIFPGALSWFSLFMSFLLSWRAPALVFYFLVVFVIFWFLRSIYFAFHLHFGFKRMQRHEKVDWLKRLREIPVEHYSIDIKDWHDIYHLILLPNATESTAVIRDTLQSLVDCDYPKNRMVVVLSFEQRAGEERKLIAEEIKKEFGNSFFKLVMTFHPSNLPGEITGHGPNDAWAAKQAKAVVIDPLRIPYENVIVSSFDIDTRIFPKYFSCLAYHYLTCEKPTRSSFQPIPLYHNNIWDAPPFSQISSFSSTFWQIMCQERPTQLISFSSHSMSFKALVDVGFKQTNIIPDDSRIFWQCFFRYDGDYRVVPIFYPVSMDANLGKNVWATLKNIYKQKTRWAYGVEDIPYFLYACRKNKRVPFAKKLSRGIELISGHWSWAIASILVFALGWLPILFGGAEFSQSLLAYSVPKMASRVMTFAMIGLISSIWLSIILLPQRPLQYRKIKYFWFVLGWFLIPLDMVLLGSLPALEAQTRCMLGKYMKQFWVTPKDRKL